MVKVIVVLLALTSAIQFTSGQSRCYNPNRKNGVCVSIYDCPPLLGVVSQKPLPDRDRRFLLASQCSGGSGQTPHVCCNEDTGFVTVTTTYRPFTTRRIGPIAPSNGRGNILPTPPNCGRETAGNRIYGGNLTELDEFPWMVLLMYRTARGETSLSCGGSLINQRYVVTAAHCILGAIEREIGSLYGVRLGEYDTTRDLDCIDRDCAEPVVEVGIEQITTHENFIPDSPHRHHDIALIRLSQDVKYSDFIRPICLPSTVNFQKSNPGNVVVVAGWGRTLKVSRSAIKQKLSLPISDQEDCRRRFSTKNVNIINTQLCAGGRYTEDSCDGDSGGPLMTFTRNYWVLEGIISFGNKCGLLGWPAVYTRVSSFDRWIRSNLRP